MRLKLLACKSMWREFSHMASVSPHDIDITFIPYDCGDDINNELKQYIDNLSGGYDGVILGFGLCEQLVGGISSNKYKLIIPKAHNCVSILLGSRERYRHINEINGGEIFWYTKTFEQIGAEEIISGNKKHYDYFCSIVSPFLGSGDIYKPEKDCQGEQREYTANLSLISNLVNGNWDSDEILVLECGEKAVISYTNSVLEKSK